MGPKKISNAESEPSASSYQARQALLNELFTLTYEELRRLASTVSGNTGSATLNPTALVNEAWIKLMRHPDCTFSSKLHFKRIAARAMRQVLVDAARRRISAKRGGPAFMLSSLDEVSGILPGQQEDLLFLDSALKELEQIEPRQAMLVESRFFGGLEVSEAAKLLDISEATVHREWRVARAWLAHRLQQSKAYSASAE